MKLDVLEDGLELSHVLDEDSLIAKHVQAAYYLVLDSKQRLISMALEQGLKADVSRESGSWIVKQFYHWHQKVIKSVIKEQVVDVGSLNDL